MSNLRVFGDLQSHGSEEPSSEQPQLSQRLEELERRPGNSRRRPREEEPNEPRRRQRVPSIRSLVVVFEVEPAFESRTEAIFAGRFHNEDTEVHAWSQVEGVGHYRWLQGPMAHLPRERQLEYVAVTMRQIFDFLRL